MNEVAVGEVDAGAEPRRDEPPLLLLVESAAAMPVSPVQGCELVRGEGKGEGRVEDVEENTEDPGESSPPSVLLLPPPKEEPPGSFEDKDEDDNLRDPFADEDDEI